MSDIFIVPLRRRKKVLTESILRMPTVVIPPNTTTTVVAYPSNPFKANRLVTAQSYPTIFLMDVRVGNYSQMIDDASNGICLSTFHYADKLDEVLRRLRDGQTICGHHGAANVGLIEAVMEMCKTFKCETTLSVAMLLSMVMFNRGSTDVEVSCHWQGESIT